MRKLFIAAWLAVPLAALSGSPQTVVLDVRNMTCGLCPITVRKALQRVPGVVDAKIDFEAKTAMVTFDPDKASPAVLVEATTRAGYPATLRK